MRWGRCPCSCCSTRPAPGARGRTCRGRQAATRAALRRPPGSVAGPSWASPRTPRRTLGPWRRASRGARPSARFAAVSSASTPRPLTSRPGHGGCWHLGPPRWSLCAVCGHCCAPAPAGGRSSAATWRPARGPGWTWPASCSGRSASGRRSTICSARSARATRRGCSRPWRRRPSCTAARRRAAPRRQAASCPSRLGMCGMGTRSGACAWSCAWRSTTRASRRRCASGVCSARA
mmetsp:Transcript_102593/g.319715  ORF Transcript_102593/g.319715 Transcript_102593/m.319715 type:complete len:234 (-) Transcript_102593:293-994(-)